MPDFPIKITGDASELTKATDEAKEQLDQAGKSVEMLGDLIGVKVPDAIKKMIASSELVGPALSEAFAPLTAVTFGIEIIGKLAEKIKEVTNDMAGWDASGRWSPKIATFCSSEINTNFVKSSLNPRTRFFRLRPSARRAASGKVRNL